ncbi:glycosyltransferase [Phormidium sp. FACHB-592]|uniref:Glycosyltransferase n=1 Tax=Stenomitos frigidus AS-A4 TaxID=2933935 RepID=A0ABV0KPP7_9CYAN|nr:glycosyltransferase [Phormidium sp. FACHB-592]MBD2074162.1 glycosyltransferase [Phormidium sp. FACHB-592]
MAEIGLGITLLSLIIWLVLLFGRGQFWRSDQFLDEEAEGRLPRASADGRQKAEGTLSPLPTPHSPLPSVCAIIPARNEADLLPVTLRSLLTQGYPNLRIILVDDQSTDGTADIARQTAQALDPSRLTVITAEPLPVGWTGKLWAMEQGARYAQTLSPPPDYFLLTDADISHHSENLHQLVAKAQADDLDLVSLMVLLRCKSTWEKLLIPAFVFFFQKLYPFRWANDPNRKLAAAAGGCILLRRDALTQIGGLQILRQALIDDCSLAQAVKGLGRGQEAGGRGKKAGGRGQEAEGRGQETGEAREVGGQTSELTPYSTLHTPPPAPHTLHPTGKIWLGLTRQTLSLRPYPSLKTIWDMVARTAFTQLNYSPLLLFGTLVGMTIIYVVPPVSTIAGLLTGQWTIALVGLLTWLLIGVAYVPTLRLYQCPPLLAFGLPAIAFLYTIMTLDSALRHWRGEGGAWKGRVY